jgi:hypothetical protein
MEVRSSWQCFENASDFEIVLIIPANDLVHGSSLPKYFFCGFSVSITEKGSLNTFFGFPFSTSTVNTSKNLNRQRNHSAH